MTSAGSAAQEVLVRRGFALEYVPLGWNVVGIVVLATAAAGARPVALAGFGQDSLIETGASVVVVWELSGTGAHRQRRGLRLIGFAFLALAVYLLVQPTVVLGLVLNAGLGWWWADPAARGTCSSATPPVRAGRSSPLMTDPGMLPAGPGVTGLSPSSS